MLSHTNIKLLEMTSTNQSKIIFLMFVNMLVHTFLLVAISPIQMATLCLGGQIRLIHPFLTEPSPKPTHNSKAGNMACCGVNKSLRKYMVPASPE